jgi:hypothetical protein
MTELATKLMVDVESVNVVYGKIPSGLIEGWDGIVYYFQTSNTYDTALHEKIVNKLIDQLESQSFDHWSEWRKTKVEVVVWNEHSQITLVSFRVKDSY